MLTVSVTKKAQKIISAFTPKEKSTHDYLIELYGNTVGKIMNSQREIEVHGNDKPVYRNEIKYGCDAEFRLKYIWQCLDIYASYDYETNVLSLKSAVYSDKDK